MSTILAYAHFTFPIEDMQEVKEWHEAVFKLDTGARLHMVMHTEKTPDYRGTASLSLMWQYDVSYAELPHPNTAALAGKMNDLLALLPPTWEVGS